jgi:hypothetical protein
VGLLKKAKKAWWWLGLGKDLGELQEAIVAEDAVKQYEAGTTAKKVAVALAQGAGSAVLAVAIPALLEFGMDGAVLRALLEGQGISPEVSLPLTVLINALVKGISNWYKNRDKGKDA